MAIEQQKADFPESSEEAEDEEGGVPVEGAAGAKEESAKEEESEDGEEEEQSAVIMNPVTGNDLLDTVHASLSALTTLIPLVGESALGNLGDMAHAFTDTKAPNYIALLPEDEQDTARTEVGLARASFIAAYADAQFSARLIELKTYIERLQAFDNIPGKDADAHALTTEAQARSEVVLSAFDQSDSSSEFPASDCWKQLSITQDRQHLTSIKPNINILRIQRQRHHMALESLPQKRLQVQSSLLDNLLALRDFELETGFVVGEVEVGGEFLQAFVVDFEGAQEGSSGFGWVAGAPFAARLFFLVGGFLEFVGGSGFWGFCLWGFAWAGKLLSFGHGYGCFGWLPV